MLYNNKRRKMMFFPAIKSIIIKTTTILLILLIFTPFLLAREKNLSRTTNYDESKDLTELQRQARLYRNQGLELQRIGNLEGAMALYQKAIELDPSYAVVYNDSGILYETKGFIRYAEDSYLKAIQADPYYLSPYSNLALLYENQRLLDKAALYWKRRAELGLPDDPWTQKAKQRVRDIKMVQEGAPDTSSEQAVFDLIRDVSRYKSIITEDDRELARVYFRKARMNYEKGDEVTALKEATDALLLDPSSVEIQDFIEKVQTRVLTR